jgi:hypothetical protein
MGKDPQKGKWMVKDRNSNVHWGLLPTHRESLFNLIVLHEKLWGVLDHLCTSFWGSIMLKAVDIMLVL